MLTLQQSRLLRVLHDALRDGGSAPTYDELRLALDLRSRSSIHRILVSLEERGYVRRTPHHARSIEVLRPPRPLGVAAGPSPLPPPGPASVPLLGAVLDADRFGEAGPGQRRWCPVPVADEVGDTFAVESRDPRLRRHGVLPGDLLFVRRAPAPTGALLLVASGPLAAIGRDPSPFDGARVVGPVLCLSRSLP